MSEDTHPRTDPPNPIDDLVTELLECGAVLSQIISHMVAYQAAGRAAPDAAPIPEVAHELLRGAMPGVTKQHSRRDIKVAAKIVRQATAEIGDNIFFAGPDLN
jgi:hypothetical protein